MGPSAAGASTARGRSQRLPSSPRTREAAVGGLKLGEFKSYPSVQIWTVSDYFAGRRPRLPPLAGAARAPRQRVVAGRQARL